MKLQKSCTLEEIKLLADNVVEQMGEKIGYMYVGWYLVNGPGIIEKCFGTSDITEEQAAEQFEALGQRIADEFEDWLESDEAEDI